VVPYQYNLRKRQADPRRIHQSKLNCAMSSTLPSSTPMPLAGLCTHEQAAVVGVSVDATVMRLRRYVYVKAQSLQLMASRFNEMPDWEVKGAFALHLWQDAEHGTGFRRRVTEMRTPPHHLDKMPDPALGAFLAELGLARNPLEVLVALYEVLKPACLEAFNAHLAQSNPIADYPTRRFLQFTIGEEEAQIAWGQNALAALREAGVSSKDEKSLRAWRDHLRAFLESAGGINGDGVGVRPSAPASRGVAAEVSQVPRRDRRFERVWRSRGVVPATDRSLHERVWWMMNVRLQEMHVAELIASVIAEWRDQPWDFYHDLARHLWDETRHCMLGEVAFAGQRIPFFSVPSHVGFAEYPNTQLAPPERYAFLWGIEQGLMTKTGKQAEVALAKAGGDLLATNFQDFDWADEVLHAQIGRKWLEPHYKTREAMLEVYERIRPAYDQIKEDDLRLPGRDWWPAFYAQHLKDKDPRPHEHGDGSEQPAATY
ncbi:MAG: hypothetical protein ABIP67_09380, partial [Burkholderiales bacterium]